MSGDGVPQDYSEAIRWFRSAAEGGHADAQNRLGIRYDNGQGVEANQEEAAKWFQKAAAQCHDKAQRNLAICYYYGSGVEKDEEKAERWLTESAKQGNEDAKKNLYDWFSVDDYREDEDLGSNMSNNVIGDLPKDTLESIETSCVCYIYMHDEAKYKISSKLKNALGISSFEDVYLAHDDTLFKTGKNGFAICSDGFYCKDLFDMSYMSFDEFADATLKLESNYIRADGIAIAYFSGFPREEREDLLQLYEQIQLFIQVAFI